MADAPVSDTGGPGPWGLDSLRPHAAPSAVNQGFRQTNATRETKPEEQAIDMPRQNTDPEASFCFTDGYARARAFKALTTPLA